MGDESQAQEELWLRLLHVAERSAHLMDRLGPTVDLYVQTLIEENERLRHERNKFQQRHAMMRQKRNLWMRKHAERVHENRLLRRQLSYARGEGEYRVKAA